MAWWESASLAATPGGLRLDGVDLAALARREGTPLYVYSAETIRRNTAELREALAAAGVAGRILYAVKANRSAAILRLVRQLGLGADTCSPREVALARELAFAPEDISFNAGMPSDRDLSAVAASGCRVILDSFSAVARFGARARPGTAIGLRFDPGVTAGYRARTHLAYGQAKFGFEHASHGDALRAAADAGLAVAGLHVHLGWGLGDDAVADLHAAFAGLADLARRTPGISWVNVGGGLGARYRASDRPLPLAAWSDAIRRHLAPLGVDVHVEPGTAIVGSAGILLAEVNTVEARRGVAWVGVDAGHALDPCPALYGIPIEVIHADRPRDPADGRFAVVGNINEAGDVWDADVGLPTPRPGDVLALYPAGAYAESMRSDHCLRGDAGSVLIGGDP